MRVIPDVSAYADPATGTLVGETTLQPDGVHFAFSLSRIGGTSLASPTFAGIEADAQQAAGHALGFANPAIYARAGTRAFNDVTEPGSPTYEVRNDFTDPCTMTGPLVTYAAATRDQWSGASALTATPGYDDATGVGSPKSYIQSFFGEGDWRPRGRQSWPRRSLGGHVAAKSGSQAMSGRCGGQRPPLSTFVTPRTLTRALGLSARAPRRGSAHRRVAAVEGGTVRPPPTPNGAPRRSDLIGQAVR